jgi:hypothetical protein
MKNFFKYLIAISVITLLLMFLLDIAYSYTFKNGEPRDKISYLLSLENKKIDYIFLGSSRVDNFIDSEIIESKTGKSAINLGVQGAKLDDIHLILQLLKKQNIQSEIVFIQVDYIFNLKGSSKILESSLMPHIDIVEFSEYIQERDGAYFKLKYIPFYRYLVYDYTLGFRQFFNTAIHKKSKTNFKNGYFPKYGNSGAPLKAGLPGKVADNNETIDAINKFARENSIKVFYFMAPYCANTSNLEFSMKLKEKIPSLLNYASIYSNNDEYFFNCSHLNDTGAKIFSEFFADQILENNLNL